MTLKISEYFERINNEDWLQSVLKSLKLSPDTDPARYTNYLGHEGINYNLECTEYFETTQLNTFPRDCKLGREIKEGQSNLEKDDVGIDFVFSSNPLVLSKNKKLMQVLKSSKTKSFGDRVLIDVFKILDEFGFDMNKTKLFLSKKLLEKNTHLLINSSVLHNAGADTTSEIASALYLAFHFYPSFEKEKREIYFMLSLDSMYFLSIAKIRAMRYLYETILEKNELPAERFHIIAKSSLREMTLYDPWVNMLRSTTSASAAFIGGADICIPQSYDVLDQVYAYEKSSDLGLRQSRNIFHILKEESSLGFVVDPSKGSHTIEDLTRQIISKSFTKLKEFNELENMEICYSELSQEVAKLSIARSEDVAKRKHNICGVNNYALTEEKLDKKIKVKMLAKDEKSELNKSLFPLRRLSHEFEILRLQYERGMKNDKKTLLIQYFGDYKKVNARLMFVQNYFEILGLEIKVTKIDKETPLDTSLYCGVVYCALDDDYDEMFKNAELPKGQPLYLAGKKYQKDSIQNLYMGQNVLNLLSDFVQRELKI